MQQGTLPRSTAGCHTFVQAHTLPLRHRWPEECVCRSTRPQLPADLAEARLRKQLGLGASSLAVAGGLILGLQTEQLREPLTRVCLAAAALAATAAAAAWLAKRNNLQAELHNGRVYLGWGAPRTGPPLQPGAVKVRASGPGRGNGAFAAAAVPAGTCLGAYEGELIDEATFWRRYPDGKSDFCIGIDREWTLDASERVADTAAFSPCHMNHSGKRANVIRSCRRIDREVLFFATRDIQVGEELLLDYGAKYWSGRKHLLIDD